MHSDYVGYTVAVMAGFGSCGALEGFKRIKEVSGYYAVDSHSHPNVLSRIEYAKKLCYQGAR